MFNRHSDDSQHNHTYQTVSVNVAPSSANQGMASAIVAIVAIGMGLAAVAVVALLVWQVIVSLFATLTTIVTALLAAVTALAPWLVGGGVLLALGIVALRSLPQAIEEAAAIRQHYIASRQPMMLEAKDVDNHVLDLRPVRIVNAIDTE